MLSDSGGAVLLKLYIKTIGIIAPGIRTWNEAKKALCDPDNYVSCPVDKKLDSLLPANERRRATRVTQLALAAAQQTGSPEALSQCLQVFSSSNGDLSTFNQISLALAMAGRPVSPTRFHNSVHNAPAGYWSIATQSQTPSTSITAYTDSLAAGLLEASVQLNAHDNVNKRDCLLVCYDEIPPDAFSSQFIITEEFACALTLSQSSENALAELHISLGSGSEALSELSHNSMEALRLSNPQAALLPLLNIIAHAQYNQNLHTATITLPYFELGINIRVTPLQHD